jgi:versiconal hemiacetal acetate esterase
MFGCSAGGSLSLGTAHKLIELGRRGQLKAVINLAGGTVHAKNVPARIQHLYVSMEENAEGVPIIDRQATRIINGEFTPPRRLHL